MVAPKKTNSSLSKTLTPPKAKAKAKPKLAITTNAKDTKAATFAVMGRARAGGELGYKKAAAKIVNQETKSMNPIPAFAYSTRRTAPLEMQMKSDRQRTATRAKAQLKRNDNSSSTKQTSTKQIDYANNNKPAFKVNKPVLKKK